MFRSWSPLQSVPTGTSSGDQTGLREPRTTSVRHVSDHWPSSLHLNSSMYGLGLLPNQPLVSSCSAASRRLASCLLCRSSSARISREPLLPGGTPSRGSWEVRALTSSPSVHSRRPRKSCLLRSGDGASMSYTSNLSEMIAVVTVTAVTSRLVWRDVAQVIQSSTILKNHYHG